jgi:hypothetical protein
MLLDRGDKIRENVETLWDEEGFQLGPILGNATAKKCFGTVYHVRDTEKLSGCARFDRIEILSQFRNEKEIFARAGCVMLFPGDKGEGAVKQKKQAEVTYDATLEWLRAMDARSAAPRRGVRVSFNACRLINIKRPKSGSQQACTIMLLCGLNESVLEMNEIGFMRKRKQFGRMAALRNLKANDEREKKTLRESDSG